MERQIDHQERKNIFWEKHENKSCSKCGHEQDIEQLLDAQ